MKIVAILQARCNSTRLPNKVLKLIQGKPMLQCQIERLQNCRSLDQLIVATSDHDTDLPIVKLCGSIGIQCFTGDLQNVLDRMYNASCEAQADVVVRLTGDCPLTDAEIIDSVVEKHLEEQNDYTSNIDPETFPDGLDVEVMSFSALKTAWLNANSSSDLEHVTPYIKSCDEFKKGSLLSSVDYSNYRWTVDEQIDFEFVSQVYGILGIEGRYFSSDEIYQLLESRPDLQRVNSYISRNQGYKNSILHDAIEKKS